jgi:hypothetical protein
MDVRGLVICMSNDGYTASLELHKVYAVVAPYPNDPDSFVRIIDESGEDYLYPSDWFEPVNLGVALEARIVESVSAA